MSQVSEKKLQEVREQILNLKQSPLYEYRQQNNYQPVIGSGSADARVMLVGEAPGKNEAETGEPFVGAAGQILDQLLKRIGLDRNKVYISNVVKDRPPGNRDPKPEEIKLYGPFLERQIEIIQPEVIVPLGRFSMNYIIKLFGLRERLDTISQLHGQIFQVQTEGGLIKILPMYHPAFALYNRRKLPEMEQDFEKLKQVITE
ncbi:MAG: uracil-DNA glycosylase [Candidatus Pacebacteria bacterium]|nr:uracil-DNA glycosylase [Candidatus Paceibacterota bacterium]